MAEGSSAAHVDYGAPPHQDAAREWPTADLARRLDRALDVAEATIVRLTTDAGGADTPEPPLPDRVLVDTAILLREAVSVRKFLAPDIPARARELARLLASRARHARVAMALVARPALAHEYAAAHVILSAFGLTDDDFDRVLSVALEQPMGATRERLPHHDLEQAWIASLSGIPTISGDAVQRTALHTGVDLVFGDRDELRALARGVMYATDFGRRAPRTIRCEYVAAMVESALAGAVDDSDFVLACDLLLSWPLLHVAWTPAATVAFMLLSRMAPDGDLSYGMGTLCAGILRAKRYPFTLPPVTGGSAERADALLDLAQREEHRPRWVECVASLTTDRRASCESFMRDALLRRAARRLDFETVKLVLRDTPETGSAATPLAAQVAGVLRRMGSTTASGGGQGVAR